MKKTLFLTLWLSLVAGTAMLVAQPHPWTGKRVGYLGDSMTDPRSTATDYYYYDFLRDSLQIEPHVFARSGFQWDGVLAKAQELREAVGDNIDAIFIWAGTNDFNHSCPLGQFFVEKDTVVDVNGEILPRKHREWVMDSKTFCGRINMLLSYLKHTWPTKQVVVMTPIHRAYANFTKPGRINSQPDENFANGEGLYVEQYIDVIKQGCQYWAVPCIDLFQDSGLYPLEPEHGRYFSQPYPDPNGGPRFDLLHPSPLGHRRLGQTIAAQLMAIPTLK